MVSGDGGVVLGREVKAEEPGTPVRMGSSCFNCGEGHILRLTLLFIFGLIQYRCYI